MTTTELFLALKNLPRSEKLKVMQFLITELSLKVVCRHQDFLGYSKDVVGKVALV